MESREAETNLVQRVGERIIANSFYTVMASTALIGITVYDGMRANGGNLTETTREALFTQGNFGLACIAAAGIGSAVRSVGNRQANQAYAATLPHPFEQLNSIEPQVGQQQYSENYER